MARYMNLNKYSSYGACALDKVRQSSYYIIRNHPHLFNNPEYIRRDQ